MSIARGASAGEMSPLSSTASAPAVMACQIRSRKRPTRRKAIATKTKASTAIGKSD